MKRVNPVERLIALERGLGTRKALAAKLGIGPSYLSDIIHGRRDVSDRLLLKLGLQRIVIDR